MTTQFVASVGSGRVTATAHLTGGGRSLKYINAKLTDDTGTLIATTTGVYKRVPQERLK
jgi:acyl-coenzyme A thioesterase PaaI-like protein